MPWFGRFGGGTLIGPPSVSIKDCLGMGAENWNRKTWRLAGPVIISNFVCALGENTCEGDGSADCQGRCNGGDLDAGICQNDNPDCALLGQCDGVGAVCLVSLVGSDCPAGQTCVPSNPGVCDSDACVEDPDAFIGGFLNIGDDYDFANGSFLRL